MVIFSDPLTHVEYFEIESYAIFHNDVERNLMGKYVKKTTTLFPF